MILCFRQAFQANAKTQPAELARLRALFFHKWSARARELEGQEEELKKSMPGHVAGILAPKRLLLWRELMVEFGYPDVGVFEEVVSGFKLTGNTP